MNDRTPGKEDATGQQDLNISIHPSQKEQDNILM